MRIRVHTTMLLTAVLVAVSASAQTQARITGKIVDQVGNPVQGATITAEDLAAGATYEETSNKKGRFTVGVVNGANPHRVIISRQGFQRLSNEVTPGAGGVFQQVFTLLPEGAAQETATTDGAEQLDGGGAAVRLYNSAANLYNKGDILAAQEKLTGALAEDPALVEAHMLLSSIALDRGESESALEHVDTFLAARPHDAVGLTLKFDALAGLDRHAEAAELMPALAAARPDADTIARAFNSAAALYQAEDVDTAAPLLEAALSIDPQHGRSLLLLAEIRQLQERYDEALDLAQQLLALEPGNVRALAIQHRVYVKTGDKENAQAAFERLAEADPESVAATFAEEGKRLFEAGQIRQAIEVLEQALSLDPDNVFANYQLGVAYVGEGRGDEARQLLSHFLDLAPDHPEAGSAQAMLEYLE